MKGMGKGLRTHVRAVRSPGMSGGEEGGRWEGKGFGVFDAVLILFCFFSLIKERKERREKILINDHEYSLNKFT